MWVTANLTNGLHTLFSSTSRRAAVRHGDLPAARDLRAVHRGRHRRAPPGAGPTTRRSSRSRRCWCSTRSRTGICSRWRSRAARCGPGREIVRSRPECSSGSAPRRSCIRCSCCCRSCCWRSGPGSGVRPPGASSARSSPGWPSNLPLSLAYYSGWRVFYSFSFIARRRGEHLLVHGPLPGHGRLQRRLLPRPGAPSGIAVAFLLIGALGAVVVAGAASPRSSRGSPSWPSCQCSRSCSPPRCGARSTRSGWCRWSRWPARAGGWRWSGSSARSRSGSRRCSGCSASSTPDRGIDYGWLMLVLLIRDALLISIAVLVIREIWYPELDVVRADPLEDPGGGPFDGADRSPDRVPGRPLRPGPRRRPAGLRVGRAGLGGAAAGLDAAAGSDARALATRDRRERLAQVGDVGALARPARRASRR